MANRYANLVSTNKIKDEYTKINSGFDKVQTDMDAEIAAREQTDANLAQEVTNREAAVAAVDNRVDQIIQGGGPDKDAELVDIRTPDPSYTPERTISVAGDVTRDMQAQFAAHKADIAQANGYYPTLSAKLMSMRHLFSDRMRAYIKSQNFQQLVLVGDSITEGSNATDFTTDSWAAIIRKAFQQEFKNRNYGFVNCRDLSGFGITQYHTVTKSGFATEVLDASYYGGVYVTDSTSGNFIQFAYTGKDAKLVYQARADGGVLNVFVDGGGSPVGSIDTSASSPSKAAISVNIGLSAWGAHTIKLVKADNKPTTIMGMMYLENGSITSPTLHNVGVTSICASDIDNAVLDAYTAGGLVVLAIGVNDQLQSKSVATFKFKIDYVCSKVNASNGALLLCDFMFSLPSDNAYKVALRQVAANYPQFVLLDFAEMWFANSSLNKFANLLASDGVHPTVIGHEFIADTILRYMGLPFTKSTATGFVDKGWIAPTFENSWTNFGSGYTNAGYYKDSNDVVHLRGLVKSGTATAGTTIFTLPVGYRPTGTEMFIVDSNHAFGEIEILNNGAVRIMVGSNAFLSLAGISFGTK